MYGANTIKPFFRSGMQAGRTLAIYWQNGNHSEAMVASPIRKGDSMTDPGVKVAMFLGLTYVLSFPILFWLAH